MSARLSAATGNLSCIWVANGIVAAFVLTTPKHLQPIFFVAGQATGFALDAASGTRLDWAAWYAVCNSAETLVTVLPLCNFQDRAKATTWLALTKIAVFGIILGPVTGALLAAPIVRQIEHSGSPEAVRIWFMADALGSAASLPAMIFLLTRKRNPRATAARVGDVLWAIILVAVAIGVFWQTRYPLVFLLFPPLVFTLFRFRLQGAVYGTSALLLIAAIFTAEAHGPFALISTHSVIERVWLFQIFGLIVFGSCVPLGYSVEERHRLDGELKHANQKLSELVLMDSLTGVRNRRGFDKRLESEWLRASTGDSELSIVYLDIDFFKRFNDAYGHQPGDDCLRSVAQALSSSVRPEDCVARYGGEEFVILLAGRSADSAKQVADRAAAAILNLRIPHRESPFGIVTASFGVATVRPACGGNSYRLIKMADDALYAAKSAGRSRIECRSVPGTFLNV